MNISRSLIAMFATFKCYSYFWLLQWLVLSLVDHAYAQQFIGDRCSTTQGPGVCQLSDQCRSVFIGLRSGIRPVTCGFKGNSPIVCCPSGNPSPLRTTTPWIWEVTTQKVTRRPANPPSKQVCQEYEKRFFDPRNLPQIRRIINGTAVKVLELPHMAAIGFNMNSTISWDCGGVLISERFVLTAAHCLYHPQWGEAQWVRLGYLGPVKSIEEPQLLRIAEKIRHPEYTGSMRYNDIALLKLESSVYFTPFIKPACLDTKENHLAGEEALASGWGLTDVIDDGSRSINLLKVKIPIVAYSNCASLYTDFSGLPRGLDDRIQMCAGVNGKDTCQGDSGGPLVMKMKKKVLSLHRVVGITSFGQSCGSVVPGVYTRVSAYVPWIESIVWPDKLA